jgi:uncharacterized protein YbjT (DUF2867 family)
MNALVVGSTGLVGTELVKLLDTDHKLNKVIALVRKKSGIDFRKVEEVVVDFENLPSQCFGEIDIVFCCLGTTIKKAGSKDVFIRVDYEYPLSTAKIAKASGVKRFAIVTAMGADSKSSIFYNKVKGNVENALSELNFEALGIFRPSMLLGDRNESRLGERIGQVVMQTLGFLIPRNYKAIHGQKVATAMVKFAKDESLKSKIIISSGEMN